jgi:hypothetical protein
MCLRFVFLLITRVITWLRLSRREDAWKTAEILILRHQLAVLQRHQVRHPGLNGADRALLATLFGVIPKVRRQGCDCRSPRPGALRADRPGVVRRAGTAHSAQLLARHLPHDARDATELAPQAGRE